jgi:hypothetical protein
MLKNSAKGKAHGAKRSSPLPFTLRSCGLDTESEEVET